VGLIIEISFAVL